MGGELVVAVHDGVKLAVHDILIQWVEENLGVLLALHGDSGGLGSDV